MLCPFALLPYVYSKAKVGFAGSSLHNKRQVVLPSWVELFSYVIILPDLFLLPLKNFD